MISKSKFKQLEDCFSSYASWAIWEMPDNYPKSNTDDMSWSDNPRLNEVVGTGFVFVGLNCSREIGKNACKWSNFHSGDRYQNDYKLRFALSKTNLWGSYITDVLKDFPQAKSSKVVKTIKAKPEIIDNNICLLKQELKLLGNPILIAMGNDVYNILISNLDDSYTIKKIKHYACFIGKGKYRKEVFASLKPYIKSIRD